MPLLHGMNKIAISNDHVDLDFKLQAREWCSVKAYCHFIPFPVMHDLNAHSFLCIGDAIPPFLPAWTGNSTIYWIPLNGEMKCESTNTGNTGNGTKTPTFINTDLKVTLEQMAKSTFYQITRGRDEMAAGSHSERGHAHIDKKAKHMSRLMKTPIKPITHPMT